MSNFSKLKEMWENKNKPEQTPPPPIKSATFKSTFQVNKNDNPQNINNNIPSLNNHLSLPQKTNIENKKIIYNDDRNSIVSSTSSQNKQPMIIKQENQIKTNEKPIQKQEKNTTREQSIKQNKEFKLEVKEPAIIKTQIQRPKTMIHEKVEQPKINKISEMKKMFQSKMPMGFQSMNQPFYPTKIQKPKQSNQSNKNQNQNIISSKSVNQQHLKTEQHSNSEVQYQTSKMSFQQRRRMAQEMLKHKEQAKNNYQIALKAEKYKIDEGNRNVIRLEQEIYYYDQESRQAAHHADQISNQIFISALNKKPFYQTNEGSSQDIDNVQAKRTVSQAATVTNLQVRKPKQKKRNLQDFDDA